MGGQAKPKTVPYAAHEYEVYVVLGDAERAPLWTWERWREAAPLFTPLMESERGATAVRCTQHGANGKQLRFGKLAWNDSSHQRWTHGSPVTGEESAGWYFIDVEAWAPSWTVCGRDDLPPDVFLAFSHAGSGLKKPDLAFNPVVVAAMAVSQGAERLAQLREAVLQLSGLLGGPLAVWKRRTWGVATGSGAFTDGIQDLPHLGLFKREPGPRGKRPVDASLLVGKWNPLARPGEKA